MATEEMWRKDWSKAAAARALTRRVELTSSRERRIKQNVE